MRLLTISSVLYLLLVLLIGLPVVAQEHYSSLWSPASRAIKKKYRVSIGCEIGSARLVVFDSGNNDVSSDSKVKYLPKFGKILVPRLAKNRKLRKKARSQYWALADACLSLFASAQIPDSTPTIPDIEPQETPPSSGVSEEENTSDEKVISTLTPTPSTSPTPDLDLGSDITPTPDHQSSPTPTLTPDPPSSPTPSTTPDPTPTATITPPDVAQVKKVVVFHSTDFHAVLCPFDGELEKLGGGLAKFSSLLKSLVLEHLALGDSIIYIDTGDDFDGGALKVKNTKGIAFLKARGVLISWLVEHGVTVVLAPGDHNLINDLNDGAGPFKDTVKMSFADGANVIGTNFEEYTNGKWLGPEDSKFPLNEKALKLKPWHIAELSNGLRIGFVQITEPGLQLGVNNLRTISAPASISKMKNAIKTMLDLGVHSIFVVSHIGSPGDHTQYRVTDLLGDLPKDWRKFLSFWDGNSHNVWAGWLPKSPEDYHYVVPWDILNKAKFGPGHKFKLDSDKFDGDKYPKENYGVFYSNAGKLGMYIGKHELMIDSSKLVGDVANQMNVLVDFEGAILPVDNSPVDHDVLDAINIDNCNDPLMKNSG